MTRRVRARQLHETSYITPAGTLIIAIVLTEDDRVGVYEWDEEHGYFPLVGLYTPEPWENIPEPPPFHRRPSRSVSPGHRDTDEWASLDYAAFAARVNEHPARQRELPAPAPPEPRLPDPRKRSRAIRCPFCKARYNEWTQVVCEHLVAEGDPEAQMVYHWPLLDELFLLAQTAFDMGIDLRPLGSGVRGWDMSTVGDPEDLLTGDFLREIPGFRSCSRTVQGAMMESTYHWIFVSPRSKAKIRAEFAVLWTRLTQAIAEQAR